MTQPAATTVKDSRRPRQDPAEPSITCQLCGAAHEPKDPIFCRVCGEPVILWGWAP